MTVHSVETQKKIKSGSVAGICTYLDSVTHQITLSMININLCFKRNIKKSIILFAEFSPIQFPPRSQRYFPLLKISSCTLSARFH